MDNNHSINEFDFNLICEYFSSTHRQGPGSEECTLKALSFIDGLHQMKHIADIGCGTGASTLTLAQHTTACITAVDLFPKFLEHLNAEAQRAGLGHRIQTMAADMNSLPFDKESMDLIWSEGAIYNMGFRQGLTAWKKILKEGGYIGVTDASWTTAERPDTIRDFWTDAYPQIDTVWNNLQKLVDCGYEPVATFLLPTECWTDEFYIPQQEAQRLFLEKHGDNPTARMLVENQRKEARLFEEYNQYYGYVFYIGRKR